MNDPTAHQGSSSGRRLAAIVFTDVVDYSARMQRDETGAMAQVRADFTRLEQQAAQHGGEVLNTMGDGMLLSFASAVQAVTFALQIQTEFAHRRATKPAEQALEHRIGIHVGEVFQQDGRVAGDGVNIAARLQTKAPAGGICVSQSVYDLIKSKITVPAQALGPQEFKNIAEKISVYRLLLPGGSIPAPASRSGWRWGVALATVGLLLAGIFWFRAPRGQPVAVGPADKSIAVLPFANMSEEKDANAFFADGIHETILTNLGRIRELRVVSRTSVMEYRGTRENLRVIAQKLNVAYILEGSVQRSGKKVRVTGQLIRAATDEHLWADDYTKDLTAGDIFDIESELAQKIAASLHAALSPQEKQLLDRRPTENLAAYDLYLKARDVHHGGEAGPERSRQEEALLQAAVTLDPNFSSAWADLAAAHAQVYYLTERSAARLAKAKEAMDTATRLAPDDAAVIRALGDYRRMVHRDLTGASAQYEKLSRLQPNNPEAYASIGFVLRRQGRWVESIDQFHRALQLDPRYADVQRNLVSTLKLGRRYDEAIAEQRRLLDMRPGDLDAQFQLAWLPFLARGSTREMEALLAAMPAKDLDSSRMVLGRRFWAMARGDLVEFKRLDQLQPAGAADFAVVQAAQRNLPAAQSRLDQDRLQFRARLAMEPGNENLWASLARVEAMLGHKDEGLNCARKAVDLLSESLDAMDGPFLSMGQAFVYIFTGDKDRAIAECARLLHTPFPGGNTANPIVANVYVMRHSPVFAPLQGDPRFEALLNDPKNNQPLF